VRIVIDTNVVFSAILSSKGSINDILLNSENIFEFYAPSFLIDELEKHRGKIMKVSRYSDAELNYIQRILFKKIEFIDPEYIKNSIWQQAIKLTGDIDPADSPFIALALELDALLWTGDKKLMTGMINNNIDWVISTEVIKKIRDKE